MDRFTRRVHFSKSKTPYTAVNVADALFSNIFKHHGLLDSIVSDIDSKCTSKVWKRLMELSLIQLKMSSRRHPVTNGASEVMNCIVETYVRCYCLYNEDDWDLLLPAAEFAYNSSVSEDLGISSFYLDLGWNPKSVLYFIYCSETSFESVYSLKKTLKDSLEDTAFISSCESEIL